MSRTKYSLTDEHRAQLQPWGARWIANAMSTKAMDEEERGIMRRAVRGLYESAGLTPPPDHRIVFVASPFVMRYAAGFSAAIWHLRRNGQPSTYAATDAATRAATLDATYAATYAATDDATYAATLDATDDATYAATDDATYAATDDAENWFYFPCDAVGLARQILGPNAELGIRCAQAAWRMWQGGNQWSAWTAYLSFFRHVAQLPLDYSKWDHWEQATLHAGPRIMHPDFCIVSDRPEILTVDEQNRPHGEDAPFCRWRDGSALYSWHGVRVPAKYYMRQFTAREILAEPNAEVRRALMERYDHLTEKGQFIQDSGARVIDSAIQPMRAGEADAINELLAIDLPEDPDGRMVALRVIDPSTGRVYVIRVHPELRPMLADGTFGEPQELTVRNALASTHGMRGEEYVLQQES